MRPCAALILRLATRGHSRGLHIRSIWPPPHQAGAVVYLLKLSLRARVRHPINRVQQQRQAQPCHPPEQEKRPRLLNGQCWLSLRVSLFHVASPLRASCRSVLRGTVAAKQSAKDVFAFAEIFCIVNLGNNPSVSHKQSARRDADARCSRRLTRLADGRDDAP
jgi:hypothetical protein